MLLKNYRRLFNRRAVSIPRSPSQKSRFRPVFLESLEQRKLLSATSNDSQDASAEVSSIAQSSAVVVNQVRFAINGQEELAGSDTSILRLNEGDLLEVVSVDLTINSTLQNQEGVIAFEGYLNKIETTNDASVIDYTDGRFSVSQTNLPVMIGEDQIHNGLSGGWIVEAGWDRFTMPVVHYFGDSSRVEATVVLRLQVGTPDFAFADDVVDFLEDDITLGEPVEIHGTWLNQGDGLYHNYAEVDIFYEHEEVPIWVGVLVGNAGSGQNVSGEFLFPVVDGVFSERWTPNRSGTYRIEFTADPEHLWDETDETNNRISVEVQVADLELESVEVGDLGFGIISQRDASGTGFIMYSEENVQERFNIDRHNAHHFVTVRNHGGTWQYDSGHRFVEFTPQETDVLIADIDFDEDSVTMLSGRNEASNGIQYGYARSDLQITPNAWNRRHNENANFGVSGSELFLFLREDDVTEDNDHSFRIDKKTSINTVIGSLASSDPTETFTIIDGNEYERFRLGDNGDLILTKKLKSWNRIRYRLTVEIDNGTEVRTEYVAIEVFNASRRGGHDD